MPNPPKSTVLRKREGGTARQGAVSHRPQPKALVVKQRVIAKGDLPKPDCLPPEGDKLWDDVVQSLAEVGLADFVDVAALTMMCLHYGIAMQAIEVIREQGGFALGSTNQPTDHPALRQFERHSAMFKSYAAAFAMTPVDRVRAGIEVLKSKHLAETLNDRLGKSSRKTNRTPTA